MKKRKGLFKAEVSLSLLGFYGISTIEDYLMPGPVSTYILDNICKRILQITFLNEPELICLHTIKCFQIVACNSNNLS